MKTKYKKIIPMMCEKFPHWLVDGIGKMNGVVTHKVNASGFACVSTSNKQCILACCGMSVTCLPDENP